MIDLEPIPPSDDWKGESLIRDVPRDPKSHSGYNMRGLKTPPKWVGNAAKTARMICGADGCGALLQSNNQSGYCQTHRTQKREGYCKAEGARWKPIEDDIDLRKKGLVKLVEPFKLAEKARKEAAKRAAYEEAARRREVTAGDI